ncbi:MAG TPA: hypothetical protein VHP33_14205 [Polyangiaceae bacterium]|nr:hypothetical protein [Polyangiaceae bacterium]
MSFSRSAALCGLLGLAACNNSKAGAEASQPVASAAAAAPEAPAAKPVAFSELTLEFLPGPEVAPRLLGGVLDLKLSDFPTRFSKAGSARGGAALALVPNGILDHGYRDALAMFAPNIQLHALLIGNQDLHSLFVLATPYTKAQNEKLFDAWETLIDTADPSATADDHRAIYTGLGLFAGKVVGTKVFEHKGRRYLVAARLVKGKTELTFAIEPLPAPILPLMPHSVYVPDGQVGASSIEMFVAVMQQASYGKTFREALALCQEQGLDLCTDPQWRRACSLAPELSGVETWTASFTSGYQQLQARGGGQGCEAGGGALSTETRPARGGMCCTRAIALSGDARAARAPAVAVRLFERGVNLKSDELLTRSLSPVLSDYYRTSDVPRDKVLQMSLQYLQATPGAYSMHDSCAFQSVDAGGTALLQCVHTTLAGDKAMVTRSDYGVGPEGLVSVRDPLILRKRAPF